MPVTGEPSQPSFEPPPPAHIRGTYGPEAPAALNRAAQSGEMTPEELATIARSPATLSQLGPPTLNPAPAPKPDIFTRPEQNPNTAITTTGRFTGLPTGNPVRSQVPEPLTSGAAQVGKGLTEFGRLALEQGHANPDHYGAAGVRITPQQPSPAGDSQVVEQLAAAGSDILEGGAQMLTPVLAATGIMAPLETAAALGFAWAGSKAGSATAGAAGAGPQTQRFAGNLAALIAGSASAAGVRGVRDGIALDPDAAARAAAARTLQVDPNASPAELQAAYRAAAKWAHPDVGGDADTMADINLAYEWMRQHPPNGQPQSYGDWVRMQAEWLRDQFRGFGPEPPEAAGAAPAGPQGPPPPPPTPADQRLLAPGTVDQAGRDMLAEGGYVGPERRTRNVGPPAGAEERRLTPQEQVKKDLFENPDLIRQADEARQRADQARPEAPPREPTSFEEDLTNAVSEPEAVEGGVQRGAGTGDETESGPVGARDTGRVPEPAGPRGEPTPAPEPENAPETERVQRQPPVSYAAERVKVEPSGPLVPVDHRFWNQLDELDGLVDAGVMHGHITEAEGQSINDLSDAIEKAVGDRTHVTQGELDHWDGLLSDALRTVGQREPEEEPAGPGLQGPPPGAPAAPAPATERPDLEELMTNLGEHTAERLDIMEGKTRYRFHILKDGRVLRSRQIGTFSGQPKWEVEKIFDPERTRENIPPALREALDRIKGVAKPATPPATKPSVFETQPAQPVEEPVEGVENPEPPKDAKLATQLYETLRNHAVDSWPKNAAAFRGAVSAWSGIGHSALIDNIDALNDAAEAALNAQLGKREGESFNAQMARARELEAKLPGVHRSLEKMKLQQFSTPLPLATAAAKAADIMPDDRILEPTAGTGNLLAPLTRAQRDRATAVELAPRRAALLGAQQLQTVNADYLAHQVANKASVIITNPPWGKYTTGKYGKGIALDFNPGDVAERFVSKMWRDLAPGGRLVAVMPDTMLKESSAPFRKWLRSVGDVQAMIMSPAGAYDTRGTGVSSILLVVDKPAKGEQPTGQTANLISAGGWDAYQRAVEGIPARTAIVEVSHEEPAAGRPAAPARPSPGARPERPQGPPRSDVAQSGRGPGVEPGRKPDVVAGREPEGAAPAPEPAAVPERAAEAESPADATPGEFADVPDKAADDRREAAGSKQFAPYPRRTTLRGAGHPKLVVEARQFAGVPYPPLTLKPSKAILAALKHERVSVEQAEQALAALQANVVGHHGYLAADNVGVGKSRELALVVLDLMERAKADGRELRLLVTTKSADNIKNLIDEELYYVAHGRTRDGRDLMNEAAEKVVPPALDFEVVRAKDFPAAKKEGDEYHPLPSFPRAIYVTDFYNLAAFRQALVDAGLHGIIGDEAHRFKNVEGAAAGGAWQNLHAVIMRDVPREQQVFTYFTATPAQDAGDYQYLYGLRLWPIDGFQDWLNLVTGNASEKDAQRLTENTEKGAKDIDEVAGSAGDDVVGGDSEDTTRGPRSGGFGGGRSDVFAARLTPAESEQIPREWKLLGRFSARDLWRKGQEFYVHEAKLSDAHRATYDKFTQLARDIAKAAFRFGLLDKSGKSSRFGVTGQLQFAAKRIQMQPALEEGIRLAQDYVAKGYQVVLSVINVTEMDPEKGNIAAAIEKINTRIKDTDPDDPDGGTIDMGEIPEALIARAELLDQAKTLGMFPDPIEMVEDAFGPENVAFIVGDSGSARQVAMREFQQGRRRVAFLSQAGSTGINLDHRVKLKDGPGFGRRVFLDIQFEWSATESIQRYGRVGRSSSLTQPIIRPITFGQPAEKKFLATIANRMAALGALSKGGAESTGATALEDFEIMGPEASQAARMAYDLMPDDHKRMFAEVKSVYRSPNRDSNEDPFEPASTAPSTATVRDAQLALLFVPSDVSQGFWKSFLEAREQLREAMGYESTRTEATTGTILRTTQLGDPEKPLTLTEVRAKNGQHYGILSGLVTPRMATIRQFLYTQDSEGGRPTMKRRYMTFTAEKGGQIVAGLQIPWTRVSGVAEAFGHELEGERLDTLDKIQAALRVGQRVKLQHEPWVLRQRKDEKIQIEGAVMADRTLLLNNGAGYSSVGNYWHVTDLARFIERFPVKQPEGKGGPPRGGAPMKDAGFTAQATVIPGAAEFVERDVVPALKRTAEAVVEHAAGLRQWLAPDTLGTPAERMAGSVRANRAVFVHDINRIRQKLEDFAVAMDKLPFGTPDDAPGARTRLGFAMAIDEGRYAELPPELQAIGKVLVDDIDRSRVREVQKRGGFRNGYITDYYPREFTKPGAVRKFISQTVMRRRPFKGTQRWRKQRQRDPGTGRPYSLRRLLKAGYKLREENPIRAYINHWSDQANWITAYDVVRVEGKMLGTSKYYPVGKQPPAGLDWIRYPDSVGLVYGKPSVVVKEAFDKGLVDALAHFAQGLGIRMERGVKIGMERTKGGGVVWGYAQPPNTPGAGAGGKVALRFGGPEGAIIHEIGHVLDWRYNLGKQIGLELASEAKEEKNFGEKRKALKELRELAKLRYAGEAEVPPSFKSYVQERDELMANLVHAFVYAPDLARSTAPNAYWALYNLAKDTPTLTPLLHLQDARSLKLGTNVAEVQTLPQIAGHYWGPRAAVRLLDNHLAPGLYGKPGFDAIRMAGNGIVQVKLGLSGFHAVGTAINSLISRSTLATLYASRGDLAGAAKAAAPLALGPAEPFYQIVRTWKAYNRFLKDDAHARMFEEVTDQMIQGGWRSGWDDFWHGQQLQKWLTAWRNAAAEAKSGNIIGGAARGLAGLARTLPMLVEAQAYPLMKQWVPRLKFAAYQDLYALEAKDLGTQPLLAEVRRAAAKAMESIENRFGQLVYENLFWPAWTKDLALILFQAPGWGLGDVRELLGAIPAQLRQLGALPAAGTGKFEPVMRTRHVGWDTDPVTGQRIPRYEQGRAPWLTHKFAYLVNLLVWSALFGGIYQFLHTGLLPGEQVDGSIDPSMIGPDLYFPRRTREAGVWNDRTSLPTYIKDIYHFGIDPVGTIGGKIHPLWLILTDLLADEDYWGTEIYSKDDPLKQRVQDMLEYVAKEMVPISIGSAARLKAQGASPAQRAESFFGFTPAPASVIRTPLEKYLHDVAPPTHRTKEQAAQADVRREIRQDIKQGDKPAAKEKAKEAFEERVLTRRSIQATARGARKSSVQAAVTGLPLQQAIHAYEVANLEERAELYPILKGKAMRAEFIPDKKRLQAALALPRSKPSAVPGYQAR